MSYKRVVTSNKENIFVFEALAVQLLKAGPYETGIITGIMLICYITA